MIQRHKTKLPRKAKKAYIKKYSRREYHLAYGWRFIGIDIGINDTFSRSVASMSKLVDASRESMLAMTGLSRQMEKISHVGSDFLHTRNLLHHARLSRKHKI